MSEESEQDQNFIEGWPMNTPLDIRMGLTKEEAINHPLRWGIISASAIASDWIKSLQDVPGASTVAIAASDLERAKAYAEAHGIDKAYDDYEALCRDPDVDIVYIASKTWNHHRDLMLSLIHI